MVHFDRYDRSKQRTAEDIERFVNEDSIQSKSYQWGGRDGATPENTG